MQNRQVENSVTTCMYDYGLQSKFVQGYFTGIDHTVSQSANPRWDLFFTLGINMLFYLSTEALKHIVVHHLSFKMKYVTHS